MTGAITGFTVDMIEAENVKLSIRKVLSVKLEPKKGRSTDQLNKQKPIPLAVTSTLAPQKACDTTFATHWPQDYVDSKGPSPKRKVLDKG